MANKRRAGFFNVFARKLALFEYLKTRRYAVPLVELQEKFGVSDDTMRRDLRDIETAGHNMQFTHDADNNGRTQVYLESRSYINVPITRRQAHSLAGTRHLWEPYRGTPLHEDMESLFAAMLASLSPAGRKEMLEDCGRFIFIPDGGVRDYEGKGELVKALQLGVTLRRRVEYRYKSLNGRNISGRLEPHGFVVYKNTIYVRARRIQSDRSKKNDREHRLEWISWPADRFVTIDLLPETFVVDEAFDINQHFDGFGIIQGDKTERIVVDFDPSVAALVAERKWHRLEQRTTLPDGWTRLSFETGNLTEVQSWVQSWGGRAVVVEPAQLRDAVKAEHVRALAQAHEREARCSLVGAARFDLLPAAT